MLRANSHLIVVKIDKKKQTEKRNNLVSKNIGYLGIKHSKQDDDDKLEGVRVWDVEKDSPAYNATFKSGDIIKQVNGVPVKTYEELSEQISFCEPNSEITIDYVNSFSVDRAKLSQKKVVLGERKFQIVLPQTIIDYQFNLQYGEIVEIGNIAKQEFPDAEIGDYLIFSHHVESKPRPDGDRNWNDYHLVDVDDNGDEYRIVNFSTEMYGVIKMSDNVRIVPYKTFIFCTSQIRKSQWQVSSSGLWLPDHWEQSAEDLQRKIDELEDHIKEIKTSGIMNTIDTDENYKRREEVNTMINMIRKEQREIGRKMNQKKLVELTAVFINPLTCKEIQTDIQPGDTIIADYNTLYPLDINGVYYTLLRKHLIEALIPKQ